MVNKFLILKDKLKKKYNNIDLQGYFSIRYYSDISDDFVAIKELKTITLEDKQKIKFIFSTDINGKLFNDDVIVDACDLNGRLYLLKILLDSSNSIANNSKLIILKYALQNNDKLLSRFYDKDVFDDTSISIMCIFKTLLSIMYDDRDIAKLVKELKEEI